VIAQIAHFLGDQPIAEAELRTAHVNHVPSSRASRCPKSGATARD
jgi:hypothetical protein